MRKPNSISRIVLSLFGLCILLISLIFFAFSLSKPYMGVDLSKGAQGWIVGAVDETGWAKSQGITVGDKPLEINGQPAQIFLEKYDKVGNVWEPLVTKLTVIDKQGQLKTADIKGSSQSPASLIELASWFFVCISFWITGFYVYFKKPQDMAALLFSLCGLVLGLAFSANLAATRAIPLSIYFEVASSLIGPWLLVEFFIVLPDGRKSIRGNPRLHLIYLPAIITILLFPLIGFSGGQPVIWFRSLRLFEYGAGFIAAIAVAIYNYVKAVSVKTKQQMKIVLIGCFAALIPILLLNVLPQAIWGQGKTIIPAGFSIPFTIFIPIGIAYAITTQKLMDIDIIIRRSVVYGLVTIIMAAILSVAIFAVVTFPDIIGLPQRILLALALGAIATFLFGPVKKGIEVLADKYLYRDRYDYRQIIASLNSSLKSVKDVVDISRLTVGTVVQTLSLAGGCLFLKDPDNSFEISATQGIFDDIKKAETITTILSQRNGNFVFPNLASDIDPNLSFIIPLVAGDKEVGVLCLSLKNSRQDFSLNDLFLLEGIASVAASSFRNAFLLRDVSMRDTFVSVASHELRTPLTVIAGYTELLLQKDPPEGKRKEWLTHILDNSHKITNLVDELLNVTRIQSGKVTMKLEKVPVSEIFQDQLTMVEGKSNHEFTVDIEAGLPLVVVDKDKFGGVIGNLLNNAIKYSPDGGSIILSAHNEPRIHRVVISIIDHGIGIGEKDRDSLFKTFQRIQRPETRNIRGSGLGLYIAKEWIKAMHGDIWLQSELNKGSIFFVSVPASN